MQDTELRLTKLKLNVQSDITRLFAETTEPEEAIGQALDLVANNLFTGCGAVWGAYWAKTPDGTHLHLAQFRQTLNDAPVREFERVSRETLFAPGVGLPGRVWQTAKPHFIRDIHKDPNLPRLAIARACTYNTAIAFPVQHNGVILGVIEFFSQKEFDVEGEVEQLLETLSLQIGQVIVQKSIESERNFLATMMQHAPLSIITFGPDRIVTNWNSTAEKFFGKNASQAKGKSIDAILPPSLLTLLAELDATILQSIPKINDYECTVQFRSEGISIPCEIDYGCITEGCDQKILAVRDVTQRKQAEKRISEFYSIVSHEIRSPLTSVRAALGLIAGGVADLSESHELISVAIESTDRVVRLLNDMLDFQKAEAGKMILHPRNINVADLINRTIEAHATIADQAGIKLRHQVATTESATLTADPDRVLQILTNLVSNAIKFSPSGTEVFLRTKPGTAPDTTRFEVQDNGPGIAEEDLPKLFQKFQQLDSTDSRQKQGTGLGLAISKSLVEQHGGQIGVQTKPTEGSTFWFELPKS